MPTETFDLVIVGAGICGSALAMAMAPHARVLLVEREPKFRDRVRGESLMSWGSADARELGVYDRMREARGLEHRLWTYGGPRPRQRDLAATTPTGSPMLCFYHPDAQQRLFEAAVAAGATTWRPAIVREVIPGPRPRARVERDGATIDVEARLVVAADGRASGARRMAGFEVRQDPKRLRVSGVLFSGTGCPLDRVTAHLVPGYFSLLFPQAGERVRAYLAVHEGAASAPLSGAAALAEFVALSARAGMPNEWLAGAKVEGPLAAFDGADTYVPLPYRDGVALIGDAAASSDPAWGQGLSLGLRDVRTLRDALRGDDDWHRAAGDYAHAHARTYEVVHAVEDWYTELMLAVGPAADARRERALPLIAQDPRRMHDVFHSGPELGADEAARARLFGEA